MNRQQEYQLLMRELEETPAEMTNISPNTKTRAKKRKILRYTLTPLGTFMVALLMLVVSVNVSPNIAYAFERIPVLRQIAAAVNFSPSLTEAIAHEFIQHIGQEQTSDGITMRVEYVIVDQRQLNIFYTLASPAHPYMGSWVNIRCAETGESAASAVIGSAPVIAAGAVRQAVAHFFHEQIPGQLVLEIQVHAIEAPQMELPPPPVPIRPVTEFPEPDIIAAFTFMLKFDPLFTEQGETVSVNQDFVLDGQRLTFTTAEIFPTHMRVSFSADPANTAWLTALRFHVENERGERFEAISSGITAFGTFAYGSRMMATHILHSPFFAESSHLTLFIEEAVWLDKDKERVRIDLANAAAERLPEGVTIYEARRDGRAWHLSFKVTERAENHSHQVFGHRYFDESGNEYHFESRSSVHSDAPGVFFERFSLPDYAYDVVYLTPVYSRVTKLPAPISLRVEQGA